MKQLAKLERDPHVGKHLGNKMGMDLTGYHRLYAVNHFSPQRLPTHPKPGFEVQLISRDEGCVKVIRRLLVARA